jgi:Ca-activated chloride channel homolog
MSDHEDRDPDFDLDRLAKRPVPEPRAEGSMLARRAAMEAFDEASKKSSTATQGTATRPRLIHIATQIWSHLMKTRFLSSTAIATLMIVPIAGIAAYQLVQLREMSPTIVGQTELAGVKKDAGADAVAGNKIVIDEKAGTPAASPAKPVELAKKRTDLTDASKAKSETDALVQPEGEMLPAAPASGPTQFLSEDKTADAPADAEMRRKQVAGPLLAQGRQAQDLAAGLAAPESAIAPVPMPEPPMVDEINRDKFPEFKSNSVVSTAEQPVSTFSVDVDTSGYSSLRRALNQGVLPEHDAVRIEEMVNYFPYSYAGPEKAEDAFKANVTVTPSPWNANTKLLHIGIKGYDLPVTEQKPANLVFLLDVSGSMDEPDKLPLLKSSFRLLVNKLKPTDTVSIVTYAGNAGIVLEPTKVSEKTKILNAIDTLQPGGSTAGEAGINAAYALAQQAFVKDGVNRIMLATDGDFNVGAASDEDLKKLVEEKRKTGVFLSILGFGQGNYQDNLMQTLAQNGNGIAAYIDTLSEAEKVLVQEATASLFTIAKDVKIQVEFNPARVSEYRLIGYETRRLNNEDFNNDRVDAGDIGSGHTVTAIYEMTLKGAPGQTNDPLRYDTKEDVKIQDPTGEYAFVKIRYKLPSEATSRLVTQPVSDQNAVADIAQAPEDVRFGIAVSALGQKLRDEDATASYSLADIEKLAASGKGSDAFGYRGEFMKLVRLVIGLIPN